MFLSSILFIVLWSSIEWVYFKIAQKYSIVDRPNVRSSHHVVTIRGGGIIFPIAIIVGMFFERSSEWVYISSLFLIATLSFVDDIRHVDSKLRLFLQGIAVIGILYAFSSDFSIIIFLLLFILIVGAINAYNFMDGINGITVLYSLITIGSMYWVQQQIPKFLSEELFITLSTSIIVFGFFNVRKKAVCFSGDVGSVSLAFIFCFLLVKMVLLTDFVWWILFLGIYGIDTVFTIICRIFRREQLLQAHRSHFYQFLANETGLSHIEVSILYAIAQLILNVCVVYSYTTGQIWIGLIGLLVFIIIYAIFRLQFEGHKRLFVTYNHD